MGTGWKSEVENGSLRRVVLCSSNTSIAPPCYEVLIPVVGLCFGGVFWVYLRRNSRSIREELWAIMYGSALLFRCNLLLLFI